MSTTKSEQKIILARRPGTLTNLNLSPEKHGEDLVERTDLSLKFNVKDNDVAQIIHATGGDTSFLWADSGDTMLPAGSSIALPLEGEGVLSIGASVNGMVEFEDAKLSKVKIQPFVDKQAEVTCKIRIDPTGNLEDLGQMLVTRDVVLTYEGGKPADDNQGEMGV